MDIRLHRAAQDTAEAPVSGRRASSQSYQAGCAERFHRGCGTLSHRAVGAILGVPGESIRRYRHGLFPLPMHVAALFCERFSVSPSWLMHGVGAMLLDRSKQPR